MINRHRVGKLVVFLHKIVANGNHLSASAKQLICELFANKAHG